MTPDQLAAIEARQTALNERYADEYPDGWPDEAMQADADRYALLAHIGELREALLDIERLTRPCPPSEPGYPQRYPPLAATQEAHRIARAVLEGERP